METIPSPLTAGIIGCGLIGHSLVLAITHKYPDARILLLDRNEKNIRTVTAEGPNAAGADLPAFKECDFVFVCTPVLYIADYVRQLAAITDPHRCTIVDTGSAKQSIVEALGADAPANFVPGHPMAGGHTSGPELARREIIAGRTFVLTPSARTLSVHRDRARALLESLGAVVAEFTPVLHDEILGVTSHLPHLMAFGLIDLLSGRENQTKRRFDTLTGRSFLTTTVFAKSDPEMWADIVIANRANLNNTCKELAVFMSAILDLAAKGDKAGLISRFTQLKERRATLEEGDDGEEK